MRWKRSQDEEIGETEESQGVKGETAEMRRKRKSDDEEGVEREKR